MIAVHETYTLEGHHDVVRLSALSKSDSRRRPLFAHSLFYGETLRIYEGLLFIILIVIITSSITNECSKKIFLCLFFADLTIFFHLRFFKQKYVKK